MPSLSLEEWLAFVVLLLNALLSFLAQRRSAENSQSLGTLVKKVDAINGNLSASSRPFRDDK